MKNLFFSRTPILVILLTLFFYGCEKDLYDESIHQNNKVRQEKTSLNELIAIIKNPIIKDYLINMRQDISTNLSNKLNEEELIYFQKFVKENAYTSYSLRLNDFSIEKPYYLDLVIKTDDTTEKAGFIKYIPNEAGTFDVRSFTGRIEVSNLKDHMVASSLVINGVPAIATNSSGAANGECYSTFELVQHNCTHGGNHAPGEACDGPGGNDGYYEIIITNFCLTYPEDLNFIAAPDASIGSNTGGGFVPLTAAEIAFNNFLNLLTPEQTDVLATSSGLIQYIKDNEVSTESQAFALDFINQCLLNPNLNLDFPVSLHSPANIDLSRVQDTTSTARKFRCVYGKLLQSQNFKRLFENTFGENDRINVQFEIVENLTLTSTTGVVSYPLATCGMANNGNNNYMNKIKLSTNLLDGNHSNIEIAKTILHECIHAYLNIKKINCNFASSIPEINQNTFPELISSFYQDNCFVDVSGINQGEHAFMFDHMISAFQTIFADIRDLLIPSNHIQMAEEGSYVYPNGEELDWNWQDFYKYLSMQGLHNTDTFNSAINSNPIELYKYNFYSIKGNQFSKTCN